ncbi:uncharacterized protein FIBRA_01892 [Fibroporia radiculosa]|uniref:Amidohydrolase-related domain-containing protein n=1 Tax=Fibroporia radiculosa TaxID=599839 RepID=J4HU18_9APHY|nr:uncharacterized protein FIBRA_01892 [Fibroporia radiculosa]CCL99867.1 predicted protein [Fibroporia radiculosa]
MNVSLPPTPLSPSVGARRKGAKPLPRLPLSAFTPPNTGTSDAFPLPPSPSTLLPKDLIDAYVISSEGDLSQWKNQAGPTVNGIAKGVVLSLSDRKSEDVEMVLERIRSGAFEVPVVAILVPIVDGDDDTQFSPPSYLVSAKGSNPPLVPSVVFTGNESKVREALQWALREEFVVNIDVQTDIRATEGGWDTLEELLTSITNREQSAEVKGKIVVSNILPPPDDLSLPIVKLLTHTSYRNYQSHTAALSLFGNVFVNYLPPAWGDSVPSSSPEGQKQRAEWKRRIKMYISPVLEAFGYQRIVFGSSPSYAVKVSSKASDWYELARESFAELGIEQEGIDAIFYGNAKLVYGS